MSQPWSAMTPEQQERSRIAHRDWRRAHPQHKSPSDVIRIDGARERQLIRVQTRQAAKEATETAEAVKRAEYVPAVFRPCSNEGCTEPRYAMPSHTASKCKTHLLEWNRQFKQIDPERSRSQSNLASAKLRARNRARNTSLVNRLKDAPCTDCGNRFPPICMDFDHLPGVDKRTNVSQLMDKPEAVILAEIAKCELVCSNCHRVRTLARGQHRSEKRVSACPT